MLTSFALLGLALLETVGAQPQAPTQAQTPPQSSVPASSATAVGSVSFVIGRANVQRAGELLPLTAGAELKVGDQLLTPANGHVRI